MPPLSGSNAAERRITVLCDNESASPACGCEWGLSLAVDLGGADGLWLWDTGQSDLFLKNAQALGIDVGAARGLALSHGHFDHTGGFAALFERTAFAGTVHAHPACASARYAEEANGKPRKPVGPPSPLPDFAPAGPLTRLAPGLTMLTDIPRAPGRFEAVRGFSLDREGSKPDAVPDDGFLVLETAKGAVAIMGCCHSGLYNSLACAQDRLGIASFYAVLGGLHLYAAGADAVDETAAAVAAFGIRQLVTGHCTGADRTSTLRVLLQACSVQSLAAGQSWIY